MKKRKQILIVEDNLQNLRLARDLLVNAGYGVLDAGTAEEGIVIAAEKQPDLILMDVRLPGMSGLEAIRKLKKDMATRHIPCVIITASVVKNEIKWYESSSAAGYIAKPIDTRKFVKEVEKYIPEPEPAARILYIDDDGENLEKMKKVLEEAGYGLLRVPEGEELAEYAAGNRVDMVILSMRMPGIDSIGTVRKLKSDERTRFIPVALVGGNTESRIEGYQAGCDDFLTKPFDGAELMVKVRSLLSLRYLNEELKKRNMLLGKIMSRHISEEMLEKVISGLNGDPGLGGGMRRAGVMVARLRGFTGFAGKAGAEEAVRTLNLLFNHWMGTVLSYRGSCERYLGDGIMAFFTDSDGEQSGAANALAAASEIKREFKSKRFYGDMRLSIGIDSGEVFMGNIGSQTVVDYMVIGDAVDTARMIEAGASPGQILLSDDMCRLLGSDVRVNEIPVFNITAKDRNMEVYELLELK
ncbi:MAG: response regulator [Elusimicrobia bacterium]|nr:response regulator [Elusimicrobiota bacterium]